MSDVVFIQSRWTRTRSHRGQSLVEFALVLPILLVLFLGIVDFGRVFHAGIVIEAGARNAAEIVAEEYRRAVGDGDFLADPALYQSLHDLGGTTVCTEARTLPNTTYDALTRACHVNDGDAATPDWMPVILVCIHDGVDPLCGVAAFGASIPSPECSALLSPISSAMEGGAEDSRYVEVRVCYRFSTLVSAPLLALGDVWLQKDRVFTVADYEVPQPSIPPQPTPPPPDDLPSEEPTATPTPTASASESATPTPTESPSDTPTPSPTATPTAEPTLTPTPEPTP
jgi:hypothetical protein